MTDFDDANFDDVWDDDSTKPQSNWFAFEKVGDNVSGIFIEMFEKEGSFGPQHVYVLKLKNGEETNVALKDTTHKVQIGQLKRALIGDVIAFRFKELVDTGKGNKAKSIEIRIRPKATGEVREE